ncbi:chorismate-binding protein [Actinospica durhamensis]|uniref:anthranilate synthase n=1 Tax=Actinospica durhamensis TaxID=1508375 RepID=A0A941ILM6_9ACTN|nr:anthranilate synthase family protein [Actinospica durhamensis]MBR7831899.1 chorismate-binding protein [Actinospica durhamensis]
MSRPAEPDALERILGPHPPAFALLYRPDRERTLVDVVVGRMSSPASLEETPLPEDLAASGRPEIDTLLVIPYRQLAERGFAAPDDGAALLALTVDAHETMPLAELLNRIPEVVAEVNGGEFDLDDEQYAEIVRRVIADEIGTGEGANFVIKRSFTAEIAHYGVPHALALYRRLLERERGAYWTFIIHTGERTFVGASPERHITVQDGHAVMNPISGTYRYPPSGPTVEGVTEFLADRKETDELYMVVDEELKMMAGVCENGGRVDGPYLKEMTRLAHTEYFIEGETTRDVREVLRETMFAPTVTGSPLESAARVIARYEPHGRGYYSGVAALIGRGPNGRRSLDSAILIRTADIDATGALRLGVGATLVRHSDPYGEVAETRAKAAGLLDALTAGRGARLGAHPDVRAALASRNRGIARFWLRDGAAGPGAPRLDDLSVLVVDAEDTFTAMVGAQLRSLGAQVTVRRFDEPHSLSRHDAVVMGPGPGDPRALAEPKIAHLHRAVDELLERRLPFVAVCLSHQVLSLRLGLELARRDVPNQGVAREIDLFGTRERVGFYNTFSARCGQDKWDAPGIGPIEVCREEPTGEVHALRGPGFASMQFHAESVLTVDGPRILAQAVRGALTR